MKTSHRHAFVAVDMLFGIALIGSVSVILMIAVRQEGAAEFQLAASRSALHLAEHAMLNLQHGQHLPSLAGDTKLTVNPAIGGTAPAGFTWAKVDVTVHGHHRSLFGVVPASSLSQDKIKS